MDPLPPPPPRPDLPAGGPPPQGPGSLSPGRPQPVTAAGVILIVLGLLGVFAGLVFLLARPRDLADLGTGLGNVDIATAARAIGLVAVVLGAVEALAGFLVLRRSNAGRVLGVVLAILGIFAGLRGLSGGGALTLVPLAAYGFVIYVLFAFGHVFRSAGGR